MPPIYRLMIVASAIVSALALFAGPYLFDQNREAINTAEKAANRSERTSNKTAKLARQNQGMVCAIADLIAYVPAVQLQGESRANFKGWLRARRNLLRVGKRTRSCNKRVIKALEARIRADNALLEELQRKDKRKKVKLNRRQRRRSGKSPTVVLSPPASPILGTTTTTTTTTTPPGNPPGGGGGGNSLTPNPPGQGNPPNHPGNANPPGN